MPSKEQVEQMRGRIDAVLGGSAIRKEREIIGEVPAVLLAYAQEYRNLAATEALQWKRAEDVLFRSLQYLNEAAKPLEMVTVYVNEYLTRTLLLTLLTDDDHIKSILDEVHSPDSDIDASDLEEIIAVWTEEKVQSLINERRGNVQPRS
ncbi:MAG: hypothetical protein ABI758_04235 [Candidatus Woesebacteria bacterium]